MSQLLSFDFASAAAAGRPIPWPSPEAARCSRCGGTIVQGDSVRIEREVRAPRGTAYTWHHDVCHYNG